MLKHFRENLHHIGYVTAVILPRPIYFKLFLRLQTFDAFSLKLHVANLIRTPRVYKDTSMFIGLQVYSIV